MKAATVFCLLALCQAIRAVTDKPPFVPPVFDCPIPSGTVPPATNVRELLPGNINVVMTMGDSITAGFAMRGVFPSDFLEYRGDTFATGGDDGATTIANYLRHYNPNLQGSPQGTSIPLTTGKALDAAISGDTVQNLMSQLAYLIETMHTEYQDTIDFENDWKLLTIFIGANNACGACGNNPANLVSTFNETLWGVLEAVQEQIPRVFVNVITIFNISQVYTLGEMTPYCKDIPFKHWPGECGCMVDQGNQAREDMDVACMGYNEVSFKMADYFAGLNNPNFTVVVQPQFQNINIVASGEAFLSKLDCFHPSLYANQAFTMGYWYNMFRSPAEKIYNISMQDKIDLFCPPAGTYLQ